MSHTPERPSVRPHGATRRPAWSHAGGAAARLLLIGVAVLTVAGCQHRGPTLDLWNVAIAGDRLQLLVTTATEVTPYEGSSHREGQVTYLVSTPLGAARGARPDVVADLSDGDSGGPPSPPSVRLNIGRLDRVLRVAVSRESVRDNLKVDLLGPSPDGARRTGVARWRVLRSWRAPYVLGTDRFVAPTPDSPVLDLTTLHPVVVQGLNEALRAAVDAGPGLPRLSQNLNYFVTSDPNAGEESRGDRTAVNWRTGAKMKFSGDLGRLGALFGVDEVSGNMDRGEAGELWGLYARFDMPAYRWYYALVDAQGRERQSIAVPSRLGPVLSGTQAAGWYPGEHVVLFFDAGPMSAEGGPVVVRIWDYATGKTRDQYVDVAGAFRKSGSRYVPRE